MKISLFIIVSAITLASAVKESTLEALGTRSAQAAITSTKIGTLSGPKSKRSFDHTILYNTGYNTYDSGYANLHQYTNGHTNTVEVRTITQQVPVPVPQPYPVEVIKHVAVPQPYAVPVPKPVPYPVHIKVPVEVPRPYAVKVPHPVPVPVHIKVPVEVPKPYPVTITKTVPYPVEKTVYVKVPQPVEVRVPQPYPVAVPHPVPVRVETPVIAREPQTVDVKHAYNTHLYDSSSTYGIGSGTLLSSYVPSSLGGINGYSSTYNLNKYSKSSGW